MKHCCITGGIGTGKSYVCNLLRKRGIDVYDCDSAAKRLMRTSAYIRKRLATLIGEDAYNDDGTLNKPVVAKFLLESEENKQSINAIVHPVVMEDFLASGQQWMECAILYEAKLEHYVDTVIAVSAPYEVRVERVMRRDGISRENAEEWINKQMPQEQIEERSQYVIYNDGTSSLEAQVDSILNILKENYTLR